MYLDEKALPRLPWPELREMGEESGDEAGGVSGWPTKCADATDEFARNVGDFAVPRKWEDTVVRTQSLCHVSASERSDC